MGKYLLHLCFFGFFIFNSKAIIAQPCADCKYISPLFDSVTVETVQFGQGQDSDNNLVQLFMDIYQPFGDTTAARPVLVFAFGGGFVQGSRDDWYVKEVCKQFSRSGYVCAAIDYRLGINPIEILLLQHMRIFFRPMQDMRASVQYLKADFSELGNNYRIDTNNIILGGASSGAITALMAAYCDKSSEMAEMGNLNVLDALGGFYSTSGFYPNYSWNGVGVVNMAGAIINADWIEPGDIPVVSAHGDADQVVPYSYGPLGGGTLGGIFDLQGSYVVDSVARAKGVCSYLYTMIGQDHPNTGMGMDYIKSVVYRMALRAYSIINRKSFCCPLTVDVTPGDTLFYSPGAAPVTLTANISNQIGNVSLQWCSIECGVSGNSPSVTFSPDTAVKFIMAIAREGQCESTDIYIIQDTTVYPSIAIHSENLKQFKIYPQPASQYISVEASFDNNFQDALTIEIIDIRGQVMLSKPLGKNNLINTTLNIEELPSGTYLLRLLSDNGFMAVKKMVVIR